MYTLGSISCQRGVFIKILTILKATWHELNCAFFRHFVRVEFVVHGMEPLLTVLQETLKISLDLIPFHVTKYCICTQQHNNIYSIQNWREKWKNMNFENLTCLTVCFVVCLFVCLFVCVFVCVCVCVCVWSKRFVWRMRILLFVQRN
jgi:hypothetical protein